MTMLTCAILSDVKTGTLDLGVRMRYRGPENGSIYGPNAEVLGESLLGRDSIIAGKTDIVDSLVGFGSVVTDSFVVDSDVRNSHLSHCRLLGAMVNDVDLWGVTVIKALLHGEWSVAVRGLRFDRGRWFSPPAYALVGDPNQRDDEPGVKVVISECQDDRFHIGCWCETYADWTRAGYRQRLGKSAGWDPTQIEFAFDCFTDWRQIRHSG